MKELIRQHLRDLTPYSSARDDFKGQADVFLDANENPFGTLNRYPDSKQNKLKAAIAEQRNIPAEQLFIGNGSDEIIDLAMRLFCEPVQDEILIFPPTYGMYQVSAKINNIKVNEVPLTSDFQLDFEKIQSHLWANKKNKLCFVCSPNNPTGNSLHNIEKICELFDGIVIVDEAYIDFAAQESLLNKLNDYPNLLVSQTFSKAWALAAARVGVAFGSKELVSWLTAIKPPYNVSEPNQQAALSALAKDSEIRVQVKELIAQRQWLKEQLQGIAYVEKIYESDANFVLLKVDDATKRYDQLKSKGIVIRNRHKLVENTIRITVGNAEENKRLIEEMWRL